MERVTVRQNLGTDCPQTSGAAAGAVRIIHRACPTQTCVWGPDCLRPGGSEVPFLVRIVLRPVHLLSWVLAGREEDPGISPERSDPKTPLFGDLYPGTFARFVPRYRSSSQKSTHLYPDGQCMLKKMAKNLKNSQKFLECRST